MPTEAVKPGSRPIHHHLYVQVLTAIVIGILVGYFFPVTGAAMKPLGDMFIAAIKMVIGPIIFCTVVHGIAGMQDMKKVGRVGLKALVYFEVMTTLALVIGLAVVNVWQPGAGMNVDVKSIDPRSVQSYITQAHNMSAWDYVAHIIPNTVVSAFAEGEVLQVLFFALLFAFSLQFMGERGRLVAQFIDGVMDAFFGVVAADHARRTDRRVRRDGLYRGPLWSRHSCATRPAHGERLSDLPAVHLRRPWRRGDAMRLQHPEVHPLHPRGAADRSRHVIIGIGAAAHDGAA